jgi:hypothetical protein
MYRGMLGLTCVALALAAASAEGRVFNKTTTGQPDIRSIQALGFAPEGVLLVGDGAGAQIFAIATGEKAAPNQARLRGRIDGIDSQLAARVGAKPQDLEILDLAVNPETGTVYIAARKQDDKSYIVFTVDASGRVGELVLEKVTYARIQLASGDARITAITDVSWADDRVIAAGRSSEEFSSKIFSIDAPLSHDVIGQVYSAETYHVSHGRWETKAPMSVVIPYREGDQTYVIGAFSCTPIVRYPLRDVQPGAVVKGESVLELGSGNRPIDMFVYEKDGKPYVLANTFRFHHQRAPYGPSPYWTVKFEQSILAADASAINEKALRRLQPKPAAADKVQMVDAYHGVQQMDKLDDAHAVVLRENDGRLNLEVLPLP